MKELFDILLNPDFYKCYYNDVEIELPCKMQQGVIIRVVSKKYFSNTNYDALYNAKTVTSIDLSTTNSKYLTVDGVVWSSMSYLTGYTSKSLNVSKIEIDMYQMGIGIGSTSFKEVETLGTYETYFIYRGTMSLKLTPLVVYTGDPASTTTGTIVVPKGTPIYVSYGGETGTGEIRINGVIASRSYNDYGFYALSDYYQIQDN